MKQTKESESLVFKDRGVVEDLDGKVAGFWIRGRKGKRTLYLLEKAVKRTKPYRIERKTITVNGQEIPNVPVKVYPLVNSLTHWGKY